MTEQCYFVKADRSVEFHCGIWTTSDEVLILLLLILVKKNCELWQSLVSNRLLFHLMLILCKAKCRSLGVI